MRRIGNSRIAFTCPDINKIIGEIKSAIKNCEWTLNHDDMDINSRLEGCRDAMIELSPLEGMLEYLRTSNSDLRDYGDEQYQKASELEEEVDRLENKINELEIEREELKSEISELYENVEEI